GEDANCFVVGNPLETIVDDVAESLNQVLVVPLVEKFEILRAFIKRGAEEMLDVLFGKLHVAFEIAKGHFRLDHPKFREVTRRKRIFRAERRPERVDVGERARVCLAAELSADSEIDAAAEKVGFVVRSA